MHKHFFNKKTSELFFNSGQLACGKKKLLPTFIHSAKNFLIDVLIMGFAAAGW